MGRGWNVLSVRGPRKPRHNVTALIERYFIGFSCRRGNARGTLADTEGCASARSALGSRSFLSPPTRAAPFGCPALVSRPHWRCVAWLRSRGRLRGQTAHSGCPFASSVVVAPLVALFAPVRRVLLPVVVSPPVVASPRVCAPAFGAFARGESATRPARGDPF